MRNRRTIDEVESGHKRRMVRAQTAFPDVVTYILTDATLEELSRIGHAIRSRHQALAAAARNELNVGDTVKFDAGRGRGEIIGTIIAFKTKRIVVQAGPGEFAPRWRVHPQYCTKVEAPVSRKRGGKSNA